MSSCSLVSEIEPVVKTVTNATSMCFKRQPVRGVGARTHVICSPASALPLLGTKLSMNNPVDPALTNHQSTLRHEEGHNWEALLMSLEMNMDATSPKLRCVILYFYVLKRNKSRHEKPSVYTNYLKMIFDTYMAFVKAHPIPV